MPKIITTKDFINCAKEVHGDKYDYSKTNFVYMSKQVRIICREHGEFLETPNRHLDGHGCPKCKENLPLTEKWIKKAKAVHGDKYDYSKVNYVNCKTVVRIICPKHGEFLQTPNAHLSHKGCPKCAANAKLTVDEFVEKARKVHGDKYDYSKVEYENSQSKVCIICPEHGEFWQTPNSHLRGVRCPKCGEISRIKLHSFTTKDFIEKARKAHGDKYDYSKVKYVNEHTKVCIICPEHGEFWQAAHDHVRGRGCPKCAVKRISKILSSNTEEFIEKARKIHGDKYDYSKVDYVNRYTKVCIICPEHGEFWQMPKNHLSGQRCLKCAAKK